MDTWQDFELLKEDGAAHAVRGDLAITVLGEGGEVFHRRAIRMLPTGEQQRANMLVARLNGVSIYVHDGVIVMSAEDLYL
jgi:hypothetical protein